MESLWILVSALLSFGTYFKFSIFLHIHIHAKSQSYFADKAIKVKDSKTSRFSLLGLIGSLESAVKALRWKVKNTQWADYYDQASYTLEEFELKKRIVRGFIEKIRPENVWDFGANVGVFSRICGERNIPIISFDIDPACVEKNYLECIKNNEINIFPLLLDLINPSPAIGWENEERMSLFGRLHPNNSILALALIHHLAISNNLPFERIAGFFRRLCDTLIIEFVPKEDPQVQRLLMNREDIFPDYTREAFEKWFGKYFSIRESTELLTCGRTLYLMQGK